MGGSESVGAGWRIGGGDRATSAWLVSGMCVLGRKLAGGPGCFLTLVGHTVWWAGTAPVGPGPARLFPYFKIPK
jgi:hypothetical protein